MIGNPLKIVETKRPKMTAQEWCDRGNRILAGIDPMTEGKCAGEYMRRDDVCWFVENGRVVIGWRR
jgi:hypothetical protein